MKKLFKKTKGFTLIELIVVIAILAILAAILIPSITNYINEANKSKNLANARSIYSEVTLLNNDGNTTNDVTSGNYGATANACSVVVDTTTKQVTSVSCGSGSNAQTYTPS